jgi:hypothetical protein
MKNNHKLGLILAVLVRCVEEEILGDSGRHLRGSDVHAGGLSAEAS